MTKDQTSIISKRILFQKYCNKRKILKQTSKWEVSQFGNYHYRNCEYFRFIDHGINVKNVATRSVKSQVQMTRDKQMESTLLQPGSHCSRSRFSLPNAPPCSSSRLSKEYHTTVFPCSSYPRKYRPCKPAGFV